MAGLAAVRKEKGFTVTDVAKRLSVSRQTVTAWEHGRVKPSVINALKLASLFGVTVEELLEKESV